ncbi:benzoate 4-monooxygenase cytochrome-like protein P450 [Pleomassaria siparia CBS 279.74]|uniref:Benzoate 4-monooxygenase cytochrome-like protein P450 n=1 Tax=Pleomassaria siparia CBS 279.74 TaxID=1314801 RepID=A0A6G1K741_9PLEO|nr:benzoate 4-monooxygenase cytochrome-like protein P450 [Pleomassaria siparia CBS 279.74]
MPIQSILSFDNLLGLSLSCVVSYIVVTAIYRLWFHPLAKFPGPFWARLTTIPAYWHTFQQDRHIWFFHLQEKYGTTFRYAPNGVLFNTPSAYKTIFGPRGNVKKSEYYEFWPRNVKTLNTWNSTNLHTHARKRRVINFAFSEKAIRDAELFVHSNTDRWLELIENRIPSGKEWSDSLNMTDWVNYLVFDILGDLCFGKSFDMKEQGNELQHIPELMVSFLALLHPIACSPLSSLYVWMKPRGLDYLMTVAAPAPVAKWGQFVDKCLRDRTQVQEQQEKAMVPESERRKDFFHWLFKAVDPETGKRGYSIDELFGECELLIIAGSDTTSIIMSAMMFYLVRYPESQAKLTKEILATFKSRDEIKAGEKLHSCKYLHAVISEALRMAPPVSAEPSREVLPGGTQVDGHYLPAGIYASTGLYCLSYRADIYPEPFKFRPERWVVDKNDPTSVESVALAESGFCAFLSGTRGCAGKNLAWLEMKIITAKLLYTFELKADPTNHLGGGDPNGKPGRQVVDQYQTYDLFVSGREGPVVQFKKRVHE